MHIGDRNKEDDHGAPQFIYIPTYIHTHIPATEPMGDDHDPPQLTYIYVYIHIDTCILATEPQG